MSRRTLNLDDTLYACLLAHSLREHAAQTALRAATRSCPPAGMQISPEQGQLISLPIKLMGERRAIEVGVFTGYSALTAALALPADGHLLACDISPADASLGQPFRHSAGVAHKIEFLVAPAQQTLQDRPAAGQAGSNDFALVDADKAGNDSCVEQCLQLLRPGGPLAIDNVLLGRRRGPCSGARRRCAGAAGAQRQAAPRRVRGSGHAADFGRADAGAQSLDLQADSRAWTCCPHSWASGSRGLPELGLDLARPCSQTACEEANPS